VTLFHQQLVGAATYFHWQATNAVVITDYSFRNRLGRISNYIFHFHLLRVYPIWFLKVLCYLHLSQNQDIA